MPTIRQLKRRIGSVKNTAKITNALQLVAASKMRRAQDRATQAQPYAEKLRVVLAGLASTSGDGEGAAHPLLANRPVKNIAVLHITPDRGLCGGLNANLNRAAGTFVATPGPSRWRDTQTYRLTYATSHLPKFFRDILYDELKPLDANTVLGLGGVNRDKGQGDHFYFLLTRRS